MKRSLLLLFGIVLLFIGCRDNKVAPMAEEAPPVMGPKEHQVPPFGLITQDGDTLTHDAVDGKVHVADFFFTTCPTICPKMTRNMKRLQQRLQKQGYSEEEVMLLSITVDPEHDSSKVLEGYAEDHEADTEQWKFLTGSREQILDLGQDGYMVTTTRKDSAEGKGRHLHSGYFILVDQKRRVRGTYDGTDSTALPKLIGDLKWLLKKESPSKADQAR